jgi:hypothetical protein
MHASNDRTHIEAEARGGVAADPPPARAAS